MANSIKNPPPPGSPPGVKTTRVQDPPPKPWDTQKPKLQPKPRIGG